MTETLLRYITKIPNPSALVTHNDGWLHNWGPVAEEEDREN